MKNKTIISLLVIFLLVIGISVVVCVVKVENNNIVKSTNCQTLSKDEYYDKMIKELHSYFKIYFNNIETFEEPNKNTNSVSLRKIGKYGFPIEEFVAYGTEEPCDGLLTHAVRVFENNRNVIKVNYSCGNDRNYKLSFKK